jgi:hypothetical protein
MYPADVPLKKWILLPYIQKVKSRRALSGPKKGPLALLLPWSYENGH